MFFVALWRSLHGDGRDETRHCACGLRHWGARAGPNVQRSRFSRQRPVVDLTRSGQGRRPWATYAIWAAGGAAQTVLTCYQMPDAEAQGEALGKRRELRAGAQK